MQRLSDEIKEFHARIKARALLIAIDWAGTAAILGELAGFGRYAGAAWLKRSAISHVGAVRLAKLDGFPLTVTEMAPDIQRAKYMPHVCPRCRAEIASRQDKTGCSPLLKVGRKSQRTKRQLAAIQARANSVVNP
jgi:hypothetical protein